MVEGERSLELGFRRRCGWCGVQLRVWQRNLCRMCGIAVKRDSPGPPCYHLSRMNAEPDRFPLRWMP